MNFKELGMKEDVLKAIDDLGFTEATSIQEQLIPVALDGKDVLGRSQTGTGKTLSFAAVLLSKITSKNSPSAIVLAPTRELAIQIERDIELLNKYTKLKHCCVYGSSSIEEQIRKIKQGVDIVVGTPGRVKDLMKRRVLMIDKIDFFILDEADEMLSMGFSEDLEFIFSKTSEKKQVLLFSATMPSRILTLAKNYMQKDFVTITIEDTGTSTDHIDQEYYMVNDKTRVESMCRVMDYYSPEKCIIFCKTKRNADELLQKLSARGYDVDVIHGDITQGQRIATLDRFKAGNFNYLLATDVAARGIHVDDVELVINYNIPQDFETYVHRIGRTGRAGKFGVSVTFISRREESFIKGVERHVKQKIALRLIPTEQQVLEKNSEAILEMIKTKSFDNKTSIFDDYLNEASDFELKNICKFLLDKEMNKAMGSDYTVNLKEEKKHKNKNKTSDPNGVRVFLTIGKMDNIDKKGLLQFLEKKANLPYGSIFSAEIMPKFSFLTISKQHYETFMKKCNKTRYNNRLIKIERAN